MLTYPGICDQNPHNDHSSSSQQRVELTPENINSWWLDNELHKPQRDFLGEGTTPNHADVSDRVNELLQLNVGDVVWRAHRPVIPKVSRFCVENALVWL